MPAAKESKIYIVSFDGEDTMLVEAMSAMKAAAHANRGTLVRRATAKEVGEMMAAGTKIKRADVAAA